MLHLWKSLWFHISLLSHPTLASSVTDVEVQLNLRELLKKEQMMHVHVFVTMYLRAKILAFACVFCGVPVCLCVEEKGTENEEQVPPPSILFTS